MASTEDRTFFNAQDGVRGRDGGPYADVEDARRQEINRARVEDREPDLDNPPPTVGQVVVPSHQVEDNLWSNPSRAASPNILADALHEAKIKAVEESERAEAGIAPVKLEVDTRDSLDDSERKEQENASAELVQNPANVAAVSTKRVGDNDSEDSSRKPAAKTTASSPEK